MSAASICIPLLILEDCTPLVREEVLSVPTINREEPGMRQQTTEVDRSNQFWIEIDQKVSMWLDFKTILKSMIRLDLDLDLD